MYAISLQGKPLQKLGAHESNQDIIRVARVTRKPELRLKRTAKRCTAGLLATTGPSSQGGNTLRTMRSCNDLQAGKRLLVRGIAARPDAGRRRRVPVPELSAGQDRSVAEARQLKRSMKLQSI